MPTIPIIPAKAGGAGIGNRNNAKINPTIKPVKRAKITSFMMTFLFSLWCIVTVSPKSFYLIEIHFIFIKFKKTFKKPALNKK